MISRRITASLALPLTALLLGLAALGSAVLCNEPLAAVAPGATSSPADWLAALQLFVTEVVEGGLTKLHSQILSVILGAILAAQLKLSGAAERVVRYAAEYAGEDRFKLGLILLLAASLLFTTLGGLGAVILVASIMLPILLSLGFEPRTAGGLMLLALSLGGCLNPVNWSLYKEVLGLPLAQIVPYALLLAGIYLAISLVFLLTISATGRFGNRQATTLLTVLLAGGGLVFAVLRWPAAWQAFKAGLGWGLGCLLMLLLVLLLLRLLLRPIVRRDNWLAAAAMLFPLLLLLWSSLQTNLHAAGSLAVPLNTALVSGILFALLAAHCPDGKSGNLLMRALHEGVVSAAPAVILLLGIGMLLKATALLPVQSAFAPLLARLPITSPVGFVVTFALLSPLALYRGPLNLYGMGSGIVGILSGAGLVGSGLLMVAFFSVGMLQGVCDPTNTHNVWIANFCRVPVNDLTRLLLPWVLAIVLAGLVAGAFLFHGAFPASGGTG